MILFRTLSGPRTFHSDVCCWDAPASELGFSPDPSGAGAAEPASAATPVVEDPASQGAERAEAADPADDPNADPLDALSTDEDDADADPKAAQQTLEQKYANLRQRARKLERGYKKALPTLHALREAGVDIKALLSSHQRLTAIEAVAERNPRVRALIYGEADPHPRSDAMTGDVKRAAKSFVADNPPPFDTNDEVGRWMANFVQHVEQATAGLEERVADALQKTGRLEQVANSATRASLQHEWKTAATAAAEKLDPNVRTMFLDVMYGAFENRLAGRHKFTPQQMVDHYVKGFAKTDAQRDRASAAAKQKTATAVTTLPRRPAPGQGRPASPAQKPVPRLEEFNRTIQRGFGAA